MTLILYQGPSAIDTAPIVAIATLRSFNRKTGDISQVWIMRSDIHPVEAAKAGVDSSICGDCPFRPIYRADRKLKGLKGCYVKLGQAPSNIWKAYKRGLYRPLGPDDLHGSVIRHGAYGDPAALPESITHMLYQRSRIMFGYTHQWRTAKHLKTTCLASVHTPEEAAEAQADGWRTFRAAPSNSPFKMDHNETECLYSTNKLSCIECKLCSTKRNRNVVIKEH